MSLLTEPTIALWLERYGGWEALFLKRTGRSLAEFRAAKGLALEVGEDRETDILLLASIRAEFESTTRKFGELSKRNERIPFEDFVTYLRLLSVLVVVGFTTSPSGSNG